MEDLVRKYSQCKVISAPDTWSWSWTS